VISWFLKFCLFKSSLYRYIEADVLFIFSMLPQRKQVLAFSATYPPEMRSRLEMLMRQPQSVMLCTQETSSLRAVRQLYVLVRVRGGAPVQAESSCDP
jgi:superfamily II DNA/RNA helicase